jgi:pyrroline-5-carboxylate reductase
VLPLIDAARQPLVVSIAAGIRGADLSRWLGGYGAIVRCMPNTPALIGMGITGMVATAGVSPAQRQQAGDILRAVGQTVWLDDEDQIDAVTARVGQRPGLCVLLHRSDAAGGRGNGPERGAGQQLALATFTGAAQLAQQSSEPVRCCASASPPRRHHLRRLTSMEASGVKAAVVAGMKAAAARGKELGDELGAAA